MKKTPDDKMLIGDVNLSHLYDSGSDDLFKGTTATDVVVDFLNHTELTPAEFKTIQDAVENSQFGMVPPMDDVYLPQMLNDIVKHLDISPPPTVVCNPSPDSQEMYIQIPKTVTYGRVCEHMAWIITIGTHHPSDCWTMTLINDKGDILDSEAFTTIKRMDVQSLVSAIQDVYRDKSSVGNVDKSGNKISHASTTHLAVLNRIGKGSKEL